MLLEQEFLMFPFLKYNFNRIELSKGCVADSVSYVS